MVNHLPGEVNSAFSRRDPCRMRPDLRPPQARGTPAHMAPPSRMPWRTITIVATNTFPINRGECGVSFRRNVGRQRSVAAHLEVLELRHRGGGHASILDGNAL